MMEALLRSSVVSSAYRALILAVLAGEQAVAVRQ